MTEYQVIYGIEIDDRYFDYCREQVHTDDLKSARAAALNLLNQATKPPKGKLFIRSVENWNDSGDCWYNCL
jgi:hypothetical protein